MDNVNGQCFQQLIATGKWPASTQMAYYIMCNLYTKNKQVITLVHCNTMVVYINCDINKGESVEKLV